MEKIHIPWCIFCALSSIDSEDYFKKMFADIVVQTMRRSGYYDVPIDSYTVVQEGNTIRHVYDIRIESATIHHLEDDECIKGIVKQDDLWDFFPGVLKDSVDGVIVTCTHSFNSEDELLIHVVSEEHKNIPG